MSCCLIFFQLRILMATLWPVCTCSAILTCNGQQAEARGFQEKPVLVWSSPGHLAEGTDAQGLAQPVV